MRFWLGSMVACALASAAQQSLADIQLKIIQKPGQHWRVIAAADIPFDKRLVWDTLRDYDHLAEFIPNLVLCRRLPGSNRTLIEEIGQIRFLGFRIRRRAVFSEESDWSAGRITLHAVEGQFKRFDQEWALVIKPDGSQLRYAADVIPKEWVPKWIAGRQIRRSVDTSFRAMLAEMARHDHARSTH